MYKPKSLDMERASWRAVIYFNIVHSVKHILVTLAARDDQDEGGASGDDSSSNHGRPRQKSSHNGHPNGRPAVRSQSSEEALANAIPISHLRKRLNALINTDEVLADRLSGGVAVTGSGKGAVYVRSGWQARTIEDAMNKARRKNGDPNATMDPHVETDPLVQTVGKMLAGVYEEIQMLWAHPVVRSLVKRRKLKLDEWSEL